MDMNEANWEVSYAGKGSGLRRGMTSEDSPCQEEGVADRNLCECMSE